MHTAQRIKSCNGQFVGFKKDGIQAKTVLTYMGNTKMLCA